MSRTSYAVQVTIGNTASLHMIWHGCGIWCLIHVFTENIKTIWHWYIKSKLKQLPLFCWPRTKSLFMFKDVGCFWNSNKRWTFRYMRDKNHYWRETMNEKLISSSRSKTKSLSLSKNNENILTYLIFFEVTKSKCDFLHIEETFNHIMG